MNRQCLVFILVLACATANAAAQERFAARHRLEHESIERDPAAQTDILEAALRFYRPRGAQSRWLDQEVLPERAHGAAGTLDGRVLDALIERLGPGRFCASNRREQCRFQQGGRLRVSLPYVIDAGRARVVVEFEGVWPFGPSIVSMQVFHLVRRGGAWRIEERDGV